MKAKDWILALFLYPFSFIAILILSVILAFGSLGWAYWLTMQVIRERMKGDKAEAKLLRFVELDRGLPK